MPAKTAAERFAEQGRTSRCWPGPYFLTTKDGQYRHPAVIAPLVVALALRQHPPKRPRPGKHPGRRAKPAASPFQARVRLYRREAAQYA